MDYQHETLGVTSPEPNVPFKGLSSNEMFKYGQLSYTVLTADIYAARRIQLLNSYITNHLLLTLGSCK